MSDITQRVRLDTVRFEGPVLSVGSGGAGNFRLQDTTSYYTVPFDLEFSTGPGRASLVDPALPSGNFRLSTTSSDYEAGGLNSEGNLILVSSGG